MYGSGPSHILRVIFLSIGAFFTTYRIVQDGVIALVLGCVIGILATWLLRVDARHREAERAALWQERERRRQESGESSS